MGIFNFFKRIVLFLTNLLNPYNKSLTAKDAQEDEIKDIQENDIKDIQEDEKSKKDEKSKRDEKFKRVEELKEEIRKKVKKLRQQLEKEKETNDEKKIREEKEFDLSNMFKVILKKCTKNIQIIESLEAAPEIKDVLIRYEQSQNQLYQKYMNIVQDPKMSDEIKNNLCKTFARLSGETDQDKYNEGLVDESKMLADLFKENKYDRTIIDLYNNLTDFIDDSRVAANPALLDRKFGENSTNPRWAAISTSSYEVIPYVDRLSKEVSSLSQLQEDSYKYTELYNSKLDFKDLSLIHLPKQDEDFTCYRDSSTKLEYVRLYDGRWQVNSYESDWTP